MRHFDYLSDAQRQALFAVAPLPVGRAAPRSALALALGATFYSPGTRRDLADDSRRAASIGTTSHVWCLEDSIAHDAVPAATANVIAALGSLNDLDRLPLLSVRVRTPRMLLDVVRGAGPAARYLTGFVMPKFTGGAAGDAWFEALAEASALTGTELLAMPVLEHEDLAWKETRAEHLSSVRAILDRNRAQVLNVRVGGTDLCGLFGIRRDRETTIWDISVVREMLSDVLNTFARRGDYVVSGPVWEHFAGADRLFRSQLRQTPFEDNRITRLRERILRDDVDELLREVALDRANGFVGKTVIHPSHVSVVNALQAVVRDEYDDALTVLAGRGDGGVVRSPSGGKMNEIGPHELWAEQVAARAAIYGVLAETDGVVALLDAGWRTANAAYGRGSRDPAAPSVQ